MKKSFSLFKEAAFSKLGFLPILMTFLVFAAMQTDLKAQSSTLPSQGQIYPPARAMYVLPTGPFVAPAVAMDRLQGAMKLLKEQMVQLNEGSALYNAALLRHTFYGHIHTSIEDGKGVPESIVVGVGLINSDVSNPLTPEESMAEKNAAINLLRP